MLAKNCTAQNHWLFRSTLCFGVNKSTLQFDFKNENVWHILKKHSQKNSGNNSKEVEIHLNAIQLLIKQNEPALIYDFCETKPYKK